MAFCPRCGAQTPAGAAFCTSCGAAMAATPAPALPQAAAPAPAVSQGTAVAGLLLNIFIWPGLGTLVAGDKRGWTQGFVYLGGFLLLMGAFFAFFLGLAGESAAGIGVAVLLGVLGGSATIGAWIWALVTSIQQMSRAQ